MMYLTNPTTGTKPHMLAGTLGFIDTPLQGNRRPEGVTWCADNGCFNDKRFNERKWFAFLERNAHAADTCLFATAPDVVGDHAATLIRSAPWLAKIRSLGYPVAFVAQDGATPDNLPWNNFDVLFIGGTDDFKLGAGAKAVIRAAKQRGMWVHCGRVNSLKRYRAMEALGVDSADGTFVTRAPDINLPIVLSWLRDLRDRPAMFQLDGAS